MTINRNGNVIIITLNADEEETLDYMNALSGLLFEEHIRNLFKNRKRQQEEDLKSLLVKDMTREQLKEEIERRK